MGAMRVMGGAGGWRLEPRSPGALEPRSVVWRPQRMATPKAAMTCVQ
jgi:hypothetical protein